MKGCKGIEVGITEGGRSIGPARSSLRYARFPGVIGKDAVLGPRRPPAILVGMGEAREVYLKACCDVAAAFEPVGFRWRKSRQDIVKKEGDLTFQVMFQSSFRNALLKESLGPKQDGLPSLKSELVIPLDASLAEISF